MCLGITVAAVRRRSARDRNVLRHSGVIYWGKKTKNKGVPKLDLSREGPIGLVLELALWPSEGL